MLTKEFAQEVAKEVFNMLEEKWAEKRNERAEARAQEIERRAKERANKLPKNAQKMIDALQLAQDENGGPVNETVWREYIRLLFLDASPGNLRTVFSRYHVMLAQMGKIECQNGFWGITKSAS